MMTDTPMTRAEIERLMDSMEALDELTGGIEPTKDQWKWAAKCCAAALIQATTIQEAGGK